jgi:hypothetical protein
VGSLARETEFEVKSDMTTKKAISEITIFELCFLKKKERNSQGVQKALPVHKVVLLTQKQLFPN